MKQILQSYRTGILTLADVPTPAIEAGCVLVLTSASLVSVGTERMTMNLAGKSIVGKARARPDLVKKVIEKITRDGVIAAGRAVFVKLDQPIPLGYSCVGRVIAVGEGISALAIGDRVACAGASIANHAEVNLVPENLCVGVPENVDDESATFVTVGAIALQGLRIAKPTIGETFAVIGLGLIGQLAVQLLRANGCRVIGVDLDQKKVEIARATGCDAAVTRDSDKLLHVARSITGGRGVDGVLITAATDSNDPVELAGELCRDRGRVVAIGAVGMQIPRRPYYDKEIAFFQSRSYGPGRYDPIYEERGIDYPIGYVRWTERRNMEAFLDQCARGSIKTSGLITHRFEIEKAEEAYQLITASNEALGVVLTYPKTNALSGIVEVDVGGARGVDNKTGIGLIGAGSFASSVLLPAIVSNPRVRLRTIISGRGVSAKHLAAKYEFERCGSDAEMVLNDPSVHAVFIATRHHLHALQTTSSLLAGKHVFVEKPLALDDEGLDRVLRAYSSSQCILMAGFNRRFSSLSIELKGFFEGRLQPLMLDYRINAGDVPASSWIHDPQVGGGRIIGEVCHFIDLATFILDATPTLVFAQSIGARGGVRSDDNVALSIRFSDGSLATINYIATGDTTAGKERLEVIGAGSIAVLEDFRVLRLRRNGKERTVTKLAQDKGHKAAVAAFLEAVRAGASSPIKIRDLESTTKASFAAVASLATGQPISLGT